MTFLFVNQFSLVPASLRECHGSVLEMSGRTAL